MKDIVRNGNFLKCVVLKSRYGKSLLEIIRKSGLSEDEEELQKKVYGQIKKILCFSFLIALLVIAFLCFYKEKGDVIHSGNIVKDGEEERYQLYYQADGGEVSGSTQLVVPQKNYTAEETGQIFDEIKEKIAEQILNENESLERVSSDLNFMDSFQEYPVEISWTTENEEVINNYGEVFNFSLDEECQVVIVNALLSLGEQEEEYSFPVCVIPSQKRDSIWWQRAVKRKLEKLVEASENENVLSLPKEIDGNPIMFLEKKNKKPWEILLMIPLTCLALFYGNLKEAEKLKEKKEAELLREYPEIVSRFSLYIQAGMTSRNALGRIVNDYEAAEKYRKGRERKKYGYEELKKTFYEMKSGVSEHKAYKNLGERAGLAEYKKLTTILIQQMEKGSKNFLDNLQEETREAFEKRKRIAKEAGEEAGTKLLLPMGILFVITLVIIMVPACLAFAM